MVAPKAVTSVLLDGNVQDADLCLWLKETERSSAFENSISRSIHHDPMIKADLGLAGPPRFHARYAPGKDRHNL